PSRQTLRHVAAEHPRNAASPSTTESVPCPQVAEGELLRCWRADARGLWGTATLRRRGVLARRTQVELHGEHDHRNSRVLKPPLNEERRLVVEQPVPRCVFLEDDLTGHDEALREPSDEVRREALGFDGDLRADGIGARRFEA